MVEEAVELGLGKRLELNGNIVTQLEEGFEAAVRDELRGIETAAEQAPAVAAHFGHQQRSHGVLSIGGDQRRERRKRQRLQPRHRQLHLAEIDPAVGARGKLLSVLGGAEPADALAEHEIELIDAADCVGGIRVHSHAHAAHAVVRARRFVREVEEYAAVIAPEPQSADVEITLARANDRVAQSRFGVEASRPVVQELELFGSGVPESVARGGEVGQAFSRQHLPVVRGVVLQLARLECAGRGQRQSLMAAEKMVEGGAGQKFQRTLRRGTAIVDPGEKIDRLFRDLDHEDRGADLPRMRLDAVLELEPRQVARQQEIALDGADIDRALGGDPGGVVRKKVTIGGKLWRPLDRLDVAFHHLDLDHGAVRIEFLHRHDGAREHIAVAAVFCGNALGKIVDRLQRDRLADEIGVELGQLRVAVDRGADDANLTDDELGLRRARRGFDPRHRDRRTARLRQRYRRPFESLAFPARLDAGRDDLRTRRNDLCRGGEWNADHRQSRRDGAYAGRHLPDPSTNRAEFYGWGEGRAIAGRRFQRSRFDNFCRCLNKVTPVGRDAVAASRAIWAARVDKYQFNG